MQDVNFLNLEYIFLKLFESLGDVNSAGFFNGIITVLEVIRPYGLVICIILLWVILYCAIRFRQMVIQEEAEIYRPEEGAPKEEGVADIALNEKWQKVTEHINSTNPGDWRLAILEADIMLGEILDKMGYQGDSIGEQLKGIKKEDFLTLDLAWEAHRIRNQIAHEGTDFQLNEREAKRVIDLYKKVFEEFYYI